jgi:hypothetical protein
MRQLPAVFALAAALAVVACMPAGPGRSITSGEAVDLVLEQNALFAAIGPRDPELIGQAAWYEVTETAEGWQVEIRVGWGDCPAGCINERLWTYAVSSTGEVHLVEESGDPLPTDSGISGIVTAGPTCPVVTDPPDPSCADRRVEGAVLVVTTLAGMEVDRTTSDVDGRYALRLPPGMYRLEPQPVEGLMGTAEPVEFTVEPGAPALDLVIGYDTGIR